MTFPDKPGIPTKGPWVVGHQQRIISRGWPILDPEDGTVLAYVLGTSHPELQANARLIAAAPELWEFLLAIRCVVEAIDGTSVENEQLVDEYRRMLTKITGEPS